MGERRAPRHRRAVAPQGGDGTPTGRGARGKRRHARIRPARWSDLPILAVAALALALLIKSLVVQAFVIPSDSMRHTLEIGDRVLVNKLSRKLSRPIERGQVVVFHDPGGWLDRPEGDQQQDRNAVLDWAHQALVFIGLIPSEEDQDLIKRVIGLPGDEVACCDSAGRVTVNDKALTEPYLFPGNRPSEIEFRVRVEPGRIWVMGDHRDVSGDSRVHMKLPGQGAVPIDNVVGRAILVVWPLDRISSLPVPRTFNRSLTALGQGLVGAAPAVTGATLVVPAALAWRRRRRGPTVSTGSYRSR